MPSHLSQGDPFAAPGKLYSDDIERKLLRHEGTISVATGKMEWLRAQHRDTLSSIIQRADQLALFAVSENVCQQRARRVLLERLAEPTKKRERNTQ
jgi:hypothetical protein